MDILFSRIFWGVIVLLFGLSIILGAFFKVNFPFFRVIISLVLIYFGFQMLFGAFSQRGQWSTSDSNAIFSSANQTPTAMELNKEYNAVFGSQMVDLRQVQLEEDRHIEVNAVFGSVKLLLSKEQPFRIKGSAVFGSVKMPDGGSTVFGDQMLSNTEGATKGILWIDANGVFGEVKITIQN